MASANWLGKGRSPVTQVAGRVLIGKFERGEPEVTQGEEAWSEVSAIFPEKGSCRGHSHSRWRTQNKMESAGVGPPFQ